MRAFSITMVRNEIDIIETFVRYHAPLLEGMVILDNGSTDGTADVLARLVEEGLPLRILYDATPSFDQSAIMTRMLYCTLAVDAPDYILPLDADEFLTTREQRPVRSVLEETVRDDALTFLEWVTYVPTEGDSVAEENPLRRIQHRRVVQHNYDAKVIIPARLARTHQLIIRQGNHEIRGIPEGSVERVECKRLSLAHFPIRSESQARSKYLVGWLANLARDRQVLFDWYPYYNLLKRDRPLSARDLQELALRYDVLDKSVQIDLILDPLPALARSSAGPGSVDFV